MSISSPQNNATQMHQLYNTLYAQVNANKNAQKRALGTLTGKELSNLILVRFNPKNLEKEPILQIEKQSFLNRLIIYIKGIVGDYKIDENIEKLQDLFNATNPDSLSSDQQYEVEEVRTALNCLINYIVQRKLKKESGLATLHQESNAQNQPKNYTLKWDENSLFAQKMTKLTQVAKNYNLHKDSV